MKYLKAYEAKKFSKVEGDTYILNMKRLRLPKELKSFSISLYKILKNFITKDYIMMHEIGSTSNPIIRIRIEEKIENRAYLNINIAHLKKTQQVYFNYFLNIKNKDISDAILYTASELNLMIENEKDFINIEIAYDQISETLESLTKNLQMVNSINKFNV